MHKNYKILKCKVPHLGTYSIDMGSNLYKEEECIDETPTNNNQAMQRLRKKINEDKERKISELKTIINDLNSLSPNPTDSYLIPNIP